MMLNNDDDLNKGNIIKLPVNPRPMEQPSSADPDIHNLLEELLTSTTKIDEKIPSNEFNKKHDRTNIIQIEDISVDEGDPSAFICTKCNSLNYISEASKICSNCRYNIYDNILRNIGNSIVNELERKVNISKYAANILLIPSIIIFLYMNYFMEFLYTPTFLYCLVTSMMGILILRNIERLNNEIQNIKLEYGLFNRHGLPS